MLWMVIAPTISAITALPGMPRVSSGMNEVCAPALLADSGPARPAGWPLPKRSGLRDSFFSSEYEAKADSTEPPPGRMPRHDPSAVPRTMAGAASRISCLFGYSEPTLSVMSTRFSFCSRLVRISAKPNTPMATMAKSMPSCSSGMPKS